MRSCSRATTRPDVRQTVSPPLASSGSSGRRAWTTPGPAGCSRQPDSGTCEPSDSWPTKAMAHATSSTRSPGPTGSETALPEEPLDDAATTAPGRGVAGAAVGARYAGHHLVDVPPAAGPRGLAARLATCWSAHGGSVSVGEGSAGNGHPMAWAKLQRLHPDKAEEAVSAAARSCLSVSSSR